MKMFDSEWVGKVAKKHIDKGSWSITKGRVKEITDTATWVEPDNGNKKSFTVKSAAMNSIAQEGDEVAVWADGDQTIQIYNKDTGNHLITHSFQRSVFSHMISNSNSGISTLIFLGLYTWTILPIIGLVVAWFTGIIYLIAAACSFRPFKNVIVCIAAAATYTTINFLALTLEEFYFRAIVFAGNILLIWLVEKSISSDAQKVQKHMTDLLEA